MRSSQAANMTFACMFRWNPSGSTSRRGTSPAGLRQTRKWQGTRVRPFPRATPKSHPKASLAAGQLSLLTVRSSTRHFSSILPQSLIPQYPRTR
jgi:hypothetical protein